MPVPKWFSGRLGDRDMSLPSKQEGTKKPGVSRRFANPDWLKGGSTPPPQHSTRQYDCLPRAEAIPNCKAWGAAALVVDRGARRGAEWLVFSGVARSFLGD